MSLSCLQGTYGKVFEKPMVRYLRNIGFLTPYKIDLLLDQNLTHIPIQIL